MRTWILDTGPLVAYLDASDPAHDEVAVCWDGFAGRVVTTSAVISETMHFLGTAGCRVLADLVDSADAAIYDLSQAPELREAAGLMETYRDTPMDFADATLVLLAEALDVHEILTLDRRGFATYRTRQGEPLRMVLDAT